MKNLILFLFATILSTQTQANHFEKGSKGYVTAPSGLNMRMSPDVEGKVIYYLEYGDEVLITEYGGELRPIRMEWIDGYWVKVSFEGVEGYVFDGYLSKMPVPKYDHEFCMIGMDLVYPLESYISNQYGQTSTTDTLVNLERDQKVVEKLIGNRRVVKTYKPGFYKLEVYLDDVRVMDVYHLLYGMFTEKYEKIEFKDSSVFYEDYDGELNKIKISIDSPIEIKKLKNGQIKITAYSYYDGC